MSVNVHARQLKTNDMNTKNVVKFCKRTKSPNLEKQAFKNLVKMETQPSSINKIIRNVFSDKFRKNCKI